MDHTCSHRDPTQDTLCILVKVLSSCSGTGLVEPVPM